MLHNISQTSSKSGAKGTFDPGAASELSVESGGMGFRVYEGLGSSPV